MKQMKFLALSLAFAGCICSGLLSAEESPAASGSSVSSVESSSLDRSNAVLADLAVPSFKDGVTPSAVPMTGGRVKPFSRVGVGVNVAVLLGVGFEVATPLYNRLNLRFSGNFFNYSTDITSDGVTYNAKLNLSSTRLSADYYLWKGFHISPGVMMYNGNKVDANLLVQPGQTFTFNDTDYTSDASDPIKGTGKIRFNSAAPTLTAGFGNLLPRTKHWSIPFEIGVAFVGDPKFDMNLTGTGCNSEGCGKINGTDSSDAELQADIKAEIKKINDDIKPLKTYPIVQIGFAYKF